MLQSETFNFWTFKTTKYSVYSFSQSMKISQALSYIRWTRNIQQSVHTTKCTVPIDFCLLNTTIKTIVKNSLSKITRPRMIEHTDVHFRTHRNVAKRSWHFLPLRFVPMYINYAMFYERVHVVAGRSSEDTKVKGMRKVGGAGKMKSWRDREPVIICFYID